jgi:hypothetical protein
MRDASDAITSRSVLVDDGLARRLKALACTGPLHDLDARKTRLEFAEAGVYQMAEIASQVIDQVTVAMDFDRGANHDEVIARTIPFVAAQASDRPPGEYEKITRWVLDNLINVGTTDRGFRAVYGAFGHAGTYERRGFDFTLLVEFADPNGEVYLRASDEAINVLIGALDTDVESAQIATEIKLDNLIRRGKLSDAQAAAQQARYTTVRYAGRLREKLEATRRDVRMADWETEVPALIEDALTHVADDIALRRQSWRIFARPVTRPKTRIANGKRQAWWRSLVTASTGTPSCRRGSSKPAASSGPNRTISSSPARLSAPPSTYSVSCCRRPLPCR